MEKNLAKTFPFMRINETLEEQEVGAYSAFDCDCGDGWYELLYGLCGEITEAYKKHSAPVDIVIDQIKEKYGTLRFYYHYKESEDASAPVDYPEGVTSSAPIGKELRREIADIVMRYEKKSEEVCEKCGKPGMPRQDLQLIQTLCDDCYKKGL